MVLRKKSKADKAVEARQPVLPHGSSQTGLRNLGAKTVGVAAVLCLLAGPTALVIAGAGVAMKPPAVQAGGEARLTPMQQSAGAYAVGFVGAWLSSTRDNKTALDPYISTTALKQLTAQPWAYRDLTVASVEVKDSSDLISVIVAGNVEQLDVTSKEGATIWPRRYFAVTVHVTDEGLSVIGLPAPVGAPAAKPTPVSLAYGETVPASGAAATTVSAFFTAYLAGTGDVSRYVTPGAPIAAITPAPFESLKVIDLMSDMTAADKPADGQSVHVLATVEAKSVSGQQLTSTYALTLTARGGRWETTSVDLTPMESAVKSAASTPAPTR